MSAAHRDPSRIRQIYERLHTGWVSAACLGGDASPRVVFPGSFNPLHDGHRRMAETASHRLRASVHFELSLVNVDKPPLTADAVCERCQRFTTADSIWLTKAPTFVEKSRLFPGAWFVVGIDTLQRLVDPLYYGNRLDQRDKDLAKILKKDCQFLVFGRMVQNRFLGLSDLNLPGQLADYCVEVPESDFRADLRSTDFRGMSPEPAAE